MSIAIRSHAWPTNQGQVSDEKQQQFGRKNMGDETSTCAQQAAQGASPHTCSHLLAFGLYLSLVAAISTASALHTTTSFRETLRFARSLMQLDHQITDRNSSQSGLPLGGCQSTSGELTGSINQTLFPLDGSAPNQSFGFTQSHISNFVKPVFYTLRIRVDPTKRRFNGQLMITLDILGPGEQASNEDSYDRSTSTARNKSGELGYRYLTLHAGSHIHIRKAFYVFTQHSGLQIPATKIGKNVLSELLTLDFHPNVITAGQGLLLLVYTGAVNDSDSQGLFVHHSQKLGKRQPQTQGFGHHAGRSHPANDLGAGLATQMQPHFARRLLPSWDEPHLKARFNLIVVLPFRGYQAISNMLVKRKSILLSCSGESLQEIEFFTTPTMSTYLLTLVVGRFDHIESITANNCKVRAYVYANQTLNQTAEGEQNQLNQRLQSAQTALQVAVKTLERLEELLGVKYSLTKFDMIALRDFNNGGMENWGASIFHENYLLFDNASQVHQEIMVNGARQRPKRLVVPLVVAHEVAHQWFGNLLTSHTWTYLWLNEGFAQFFMYELTDWLYPSDNFWHIFVADNRQSAMQEDELLSSSRALEFEETSNGAASSGNGSEASGVPATDWLNMFDQLTYNKGAMMVRMVYFLLGRENFFAGLQHYLLKHSYGTVTSHDLFQALEESTGRAERQLETLMRGWLRQEGYPLISVQAVDEGAHIRLRLSQERFLLLSGAAALDSASLQLNLTWQVPVSFSSELNPMPSEWHSGRNSPSASFQLGQRTSNLLLPKSAIGSWFKLNFNATGYFRVDYKLPVNADGSLAERAAAVDVLANMMGAIKAKSMCVIDRFNLLDDLFAMVRSGRKPTAYYLRFLIGAYEEETEIIVLRPIVESLKLIRSTIVSNSERQPELTNLFERYVQKYLRKLSETLAAHQLARSKDTAAEAHQQLRETEELIGASRIAFNEAQAVRQAADLFSRHFRSEPASTVSSTSKGLLDSMDREARGSVYVAALALDETGSVDVDLAPDSALSDEPPPMKPHAGSGSYVTSSGEAGSQDPILSAHSSLSSIFALRAQMDRRQTLDSKEPHSQSVSQDRPDVFATLLRAYESSESSGDKLAIASALGTTSRAEQQLGLLNLTLSESYFRLHDSAALLEALGRSKSGRQLIWNSIRSSSDQLDRRQLLSAALKSLAVGLIESVNAGQQESQVESSLRSLYDAFGGQYNKLISQTIELVRINSRWFRQDHNGLLQYLSSWAASEADRPPSVASRRHMD